MKRRKNTPDSFHRLLRQSMSLPANQYSPSTDGDPFYYSNPNVQIISVFQPDFADNSSSYTSNTNGEELAKILEMKHTIWDTYHLCWGDWYNWYAGQNIQNYIHRHHRERPAIFRERQKRAYYYNYTGAIVDLIAAFVYTKTIVRSFFKQNEQWLRKQIL